MADKSNGFKTIGKCKAGKSNVLNAMKLAATDKTDSYAIGKSDVLNAMAIAMQTNQLDSCINAIGKLDIVNTMALAIQINQMESLRLLASQMHWIQCRRKKTDSMLLASQMYSIQGN